MEISIIALLSSLITEDNLSSTTLSLIILSSLLVLYKFVLKPIHGKVGSAASERTLKELVISDLEKIKNLQELLNKLNKLIETVSGIKELTKENNKEIEAMKRDVENIKSILNQFQGHLLYSNPRSSDFGNKELK